MSRDDRPALTGSRCYCSACGLTFRSVSGFDRHRTGKHGTALRRCLSPAELEAAGWRLTEAGLWVMPDTRPVPVLRRDSGRLRAGGRREVGVAA